MTIPRTFIIIKGQPKALQIEKFALGENNVYNVKFKNSPTTFHYSFRDVIWLKEAVWHDPLHCRVYLRGQMKSDISDIWSYSDGDKTHWRIAFDENHVYDYLHGTIQVNESCLADDIAKNVFEYLKRVSKTNKLGVDENNNEGLLYKLYDEIDFIDKSLSVAPYLDPQKNKIRKSKSSSLIFPFGCNGSQEKAVTAAFENQISVIQGPPGTGKTQTILNIIANILIQGKTVIVVSNNNSATTNVQEKLQKYGLDFIAAALGNNENKKTFLANQPTIPQELYSWNAGVTESVKKKYHVSSVLEKLRKVFALQEELAHSKQELKEVELEWSHFIQDNDIEEDAFTPKSGVKSKRYMSLWLQYQAYAEKDRIVSKGWLASFKNKIKWAWLNFTRKYMLGIKSQFDLANVQAIVQELQALYYIVRLSELKERIKELEIDLSKSDAKSLNDDLVTTSMEILKDSLYDKYNDSERIKFEDTKELRAMSDDVLKQYPVVLSTTISARTSPSDTIVYDYLIMDEASQVSIDSGALSLTCAKNAVIVGDTKQLPNVVTQDDKLKLEAIFNEYKVQNGYNAAKYSFLESICNVIPNIKQTMLREHYRCHPRIINFCNQKFYGGNLLIMTEDKDEDNAMSAIKTVPGKHCFKRYNQREIDVVKQEVLTNITNIPEVGIITPYNSQVDLFNEQIPEIETATVHKYQGRERDTIVMSTVDDQIIEFGDDPKLLNVAVSRAKKQFVLVTSGNEQELKGNICELVDYIEYNNFSVTNSKISSIFDYLYSRYTEERIAYLAGSKAISEYDSENLTYKLLTDIISDFPEFGHIGIFCHTPIRNVLRDWSLMNVDEKRYVSHYTTHLDFLLINHVTKKPILAIETDGYSYHNDKTEQHRRDMMKNHILEVYGLPLLRLSTNGSGEYEKIVATLKSLTV